MGTFQDRFTPVSSPTRRGRQHPGVPKAHSRGDLDGPAAPNVETSGIRVW